MGNTLDVIFLVLLIAGLLIAFPNYITKIFENRIYTILSGLAIVLVLFFIWLKMQNN